MKPLLLALGMAAGCAPVATGPRCASIGLLGEGAAPGRPYRVLARISSPSQGAPSERRRSLALRACELSADAVIDVRDEVLTNGNGFGEARGPNLWPDDEAGNVVSTGTAIVFTDRRPPPAPPPAWEFPSK